MDRYDGPSTRAAASTILARVARIYFVLYGTCVTLYLKVPALQYLVSTDYSTNAVLIAVAASPAY